jgi:hypothetical protein
METIKQKAENDEFNKDEEESLEQQEEQDNIEK